MSAHRTPERKPRPSPPPRRSRGLASLSRRRAKRLIWRGCWAHTVLPVIGIPVKSSTLDGLDSLLSTVQMPSGIPVATVAVDGAENAAILAVQMLALSDSELNRQLHEMKKSMAEGREKDRRLADSLNA